MGVTSALFMAVCKPTARHINLNDAMNMVIMKSAYGSRAYLSKEQKEMLDLQMFLSKEPCTLLLERPL